MPAQIFTVTGMTCSHCVQAVTDEFRSLPGVTEVSVDLASGTVAVHSERTINQAEAAKAADEAGYELAS
ncbi:MAG: cation transporter [Pseudonocardiales bacterium]|nr:cation transporter [Actinomycetota bacterium]